MKHYRPCLICSRLRLIIVCCCSIFNNAPSIRIWVSANRTTTPDTLVCMLLPAILKMCGRVGRMPKAVEAESPWRSRKLCRPSLSATSYSCLTAKLQAASPSECVILTGNPCRTNASSGVNQRRCCEEYQMHADDTKVGITSRDHIAKDQTKLK